MSGEKFFRSAVMGYMKEDVHSYIEQQNDALSEMRQALDASLKASAKTENDNLKEINELKERLAQAEEALDQERAWKAEFESEISEMHVHTKTLEGQLLVSEDIAERKDKEVVSLKSIYEAQMFEIKQEYEVKLSELQQAKSEAEAIHKKKEEDIAKDYEMRINSLTDEIVSVRAELTRVREQLDESVQKQSDSFDVSERINQVGGSLADGSLRLMDTSEAAAGAVEQLADVLSALSDAIKAVREDADAIRSLTL